MSARLRGLLWLNLAPQALLGVGLFAVAPEQVLPGLGPSGALAMRLAAFSNVPQVALTVYAVRRADPSWQRALVLAFAAYHLLAGAQATVIAWWLPASDLSAACQGPSVFHTAMALVLLLGGARPVTPSADRC